MNERLRYTGFLTFLFLCAFLLFARLVYLFMLDASRFPINTVKIAATYQHVSRKQLEEVLANYLNESFFSISVNKLHKELSHFDWVKDAQIERVWPDALKITIVEKTPIATWNKMMLAEGGEIFKSEDTIKDLPLPHLSGPLNQQKEVLQVYEKMSKILSIYGLHATALEWRENEAWELTLANGLLIRLGKKDLETRLTRFCKAYPAVFAGRSLQLTSVDLRYPRGMAVQWKRT
ncbi:MAG: cell division protein FtsQ/DivIB [Proteobacteria bacterium]|nr:cell division protein FtsQ/DivIB [Pseudomonadota bacterium]